MTSFLSRQLLDGPHTVAIRVDGVGDAGADDHRARSRHRRQQRSTRRPSATSTSPARRALTGANGSIPVAGWAIDDTGVIDHIDILVDGQIVAGAVGAASPRRRTTAAPRPDVQAAFPDVPNSLYSGFDGQHRHDGFVNGIHILSVAATDNRGRQPGARGAQHPDRQQRPEPGSVRPDRLPARQGVAVLRDPDAGGLPSPCTPTSAARRCVPTRSTAGRSTSGRASIAGQVSYVELLLDGQIVANTRSDCVQLGQTLTNCYGINRPDVARATPGYVNADNSGFNFTFCLLRNAATRAASIGIYLPTSDPTIQVLAGSHDRGQAHDCESGPATRRRRSPSSAPCRSTSSATSSQRSAGLRRHRLAVRTTSTSTASSRSSAGPTTSRAFVGRGRRGRPGRRQRDLRAVPAGRAGPRTPRVPTARVGFSFILDTTKLSNSAHDIVIYVVDRSTDNRTEIGRQQGRREQQRPPTAPTKETDGGHPEKPSPRRKAGLFLGLRLAERGIRCRAATAGRRRVLECARRVAGTSAPASAEDARESTRVSGASGMAVG